MERSWPVVTPEKTRSARTILYIQYALFFGSVDDLLRFLHAVELDQSDFDGESGCDEQVEPETVAMFHELLDNAGRLEPGPLQTAARQQFPLVVKRSHLERRMVGEPVPCDGKYIIIGIASYSPRDLQLLDEVDAAYALWKGAAKVVVFDLMECRDRADVEGFLLNSVDVRQTPVVEVWDGGQLMTFQTGLPKAHKVLQNAGRLK